MITKNKAQIIINVMKLLVLHFLFSLLILFQKVKIGIILSMPSRGNAEERDVSKNVQIITNLYMIIQI